MNETPMNFDWIASLVNEFPKKPDTRKNIFEIAGFPKRETVNSNMLRFYLDKEEEHNLGALFFDALLGLYADKMPSFESDRENYETQFTVEREILTPKGKYIDLVLKECEAVEEGNPKWAIIIENKLDAALYNDLEEYWNAVEVDGPHKLGIVLSLHPITMPENPPFVNITHKELADRVIRNLPTVYLGSDDRHLLFLKEYTSNINSFYQDKNYLQRMDATLTSFHENAENIQKLINLDADLLRYVTNAVVNAMAEAGFNASSIYPSKHKFFHFNADSELLSETIKNHLDAAHKFRVWVDIKRVKDKGEFVAFFELFNSSNTLYGDLLKEKLKDISYSTHLKPGTGGSLGGAFYHIFAISFEIKDFGEKGFEETLKSRLLQALSYHSSQPVDKAVEALDELLKK
ncbi:PD-(D/E)XK nuclease family protein [Limibacter armeniacum]|uniref:PD-(D/E)XK nuclease family protein n=1 Tax=Limibacter armeniacum TaxID=466084 RepID=UPI002FE5B1FC